MSEPQECNSEFPILWNCTCCQVSLRGYSSEGTKWCTRCMPIYQVPYDLTSQKPEEALVHSTLPVEYITIKTSVSDMSVMGAVKRIWKPNGSM